jgi:hypothetical protein
VSAFSFRSNGPGKGTVELDGKDISYAVSGFTYTAVVNDVGRLELQAPVVKGEIVDAEVVVHISAETRELLTSLGWTPPSEAGE